MAEPIVIPKKLGQPCWTDASLEATIRTVAAMGDVNSSRFLATHAPISHIRIGETDTALTDTEVWDRIARLSGRENVVLVQGAPGTGKSHLINWIKLRYDEAINSGEIVDVLPVLVQRRNGSLKDALEQLVEQLPSRFHRYLEPVQTAIDRISEKEARKKLATELHLELGIRWQDAGKKPLPRTIRQLAEAFHAEGFGAWLCREGGVIDRNIQQLISPSEVADRDGFPQFTADEFRVENQQQRSAGLNTSSVRRLIDEFADEPESAEDAAKVCNECLRHALRELTGLGNAALSTILRSIRQDLRLENQRLVLLIEDVSTLSVLDDEVVNAVEPQNDASLCDLTSVLGMTEQAFKRLRDNQYQRITGNGMILSFPKETAVNTWATDSTEIDGFVGRYLNAARLPEPQVALVAERRRRGGDVSVSACDDCSVRDACHLAFGTIAFGETQVGLFPFRPGTASYLLAHLDETQTGVRSTQRGLLDHITKPLMRHVDLLEEGNRNSLTLPILRQPPTDWQSLVETYLGGWASGDQTRFRLLVEAWTRKTKAAEIALDLQSILKPLSLPDFSSKVTNLAASGNKSKDEVNLTAVSIKAVATPRAVTPVADATQKRLNDFLNRLDRWSNGEKLENPGNYQDLILRFLKGSLPLDDIRSPAVPAQRKLRDANRGSVRIEGSATQPAQQNMVTFVFPRTRDTYDLIVALTYHAIAGDGTWDFREGERYKRLTARWLRSYQASMLASLDPEDLPTSLPIKDATKFLCLAAIVERRAALPSDTSLALAHITSTAEFKTPTVLTETLRKLYADLPERKRMLQKFLVEETSIPQGTGGIVVIDPQLILEAISETRASVTIEPLRPEYASSYWKSRYLAFEGLKDWVGVSAAIEAEREAIGLVVSGINRTLARYGFVPGNDYAGFVDFIRDSEKLIGVLKSSLQWPSGDIEFFKREKIVDRGSALARILTTASLAADASTDIEILLFDPKELLGVQSVLERIVGLIESATQYADAKLVHLTPDDDPDLLEQDIKHELARIGGKSEKEVI
ncbi:hypothetical protein HFO17_12035 [Rhizobium laguerreae]|uniref:hypothetical protein n=1 Tax=Rhizobium laguerreae TaxID=1076926 RepID=UPI001C92ACC2|nr:hypothetical protein [Rhizobium laguerreae]MBY3235266.1 hypothetical protein [Rhizobium laguerreae]